MKSSKPIYAVREIDEQFNERMLSIVEDAPIEASGLTILFDRRPNIFLLPRLRSKSLRCAGFFIRDKLSGFAMMLTKQVLINGKPEDILYFGNFVLDSSARSKGALYRLSDIFLHDAPETMLGYAIVMQGNSAAANLVTRRHPRYPNMPCSRFITQWQVKNILLSFRQNRKFKYSVRHGTLNDVDHIVQLLHSEYSTRLFAPNITKDNFLQNLEVLPNLTIENYYVAQSGDEIVGVCCAWDMTPLKKNRVLHYSGVFRWVKTLYTLFTPIFRFPPLPAPGEAFRDVTITDYAVKNRNPAILRDLLLRIYADYRAKKYHMILFGCPLNDPIQKATRPFLSQSVVSDIVFFSKSREIIDNLHDSSFPFVDMALL